MTADFVWGDAGRTVVFRRGGLGAAAELLGEHGFERFELLSTPRGLAAAPGLAAAAQAVHEVAPGQVPDAAGALLGRVGEAPLVGLGGGRVIDVAKAFGSLHGSPVAAIPTTMSGAEMSANHRPIAGAEERSSERLRPRLVLADPEAMTSLPEAQLRASSMNALAHGADSLYTPLANPVSELTALNGAAAIAGALDRPHDGRDRTELALGSLLCGYAIDSASFGLHHVVCQTLVRVCGSPHAETNAAVLPRAVAFLAAQLHDLYARFAEAIGTDPEGLQARLLELGGDPRGLGAAGADRDRVGEAVETMLARPELARVPSPPTAAQLTALVGESW